MGCSRQISTLVRFEKPIRSAGPAEALAGDFEKAGFLKPDVYSGGGEAVGELLARADVDAVSIVLDANVQPEFVRAALKAGVFL